MFVGTYTLGKQPFVGIAVRNRAAIVVKPESARWHVHMALARNRFVNEDMDVIIMTTLFGVQAAALRDAIEAGRAITPSPPR